MAAASLQKRLDAAQELEKYGGVSAKRPPELNLVDSEGLLDLKKFCPDGYRTQLSTEQPNASVPTNRERSAAGKPTLHEVLVSPKHALDLRLFIGQHVEIALGRDVLSGAPACAQKRRIWGDRVYTGDTDMVLALLHDGYLARACADTGFNWPKRVEQVRAVVAVLPSAEAFPGVERNGLCSRSWHQKCCGFSFRIERAWLQWREGRDKEREGSADAPPRKVVAVELTRMPNATRVLPSVSIASVGDQRAMGSRAAATASERRRRISSIDEVGVAYSHANEPWQMYAWPFMIDRSFARSRCSAVKFESRALYLETERERFEVSMASPGGGPEASEPTFRFARCLRFHPEDLLTLLGVPLPAAEKEVLFEGLPWHSYHWGQTMLEISPQAADQAGESMTFELKRMNWVKCCEPQR